MTRDEMFHKLVLRYEELICKYTDKNVTDEQFFNELCCSVYAGDEFEESKEIIKLNEALRFKYKGYDCELSSCNSIINISQIMGLNDRADIHKRFPQGIFTDRYICWIYGHRDYEGRTLEKYIEEFPNETEQDNNWDCRIYLVPKAWAYGAEYDCRPGETVQDIILESIDEFLKQNPDL